MKIKRILFISILVVLLAALAISLFLIFRPKGNDNSGQTNTHGSTSNTEGVELIVSSDKVVDYYVNEDFVYPNVYLKNEDNSIVNITDSQNLSITGFDMSNSGIQTITIKYVDGKLICSYSYNIYVYSATPKTLRAKYEDSDIYWGEEIDRDKLTVTLFYSNSTSKQIYDYTINYDYRPDNYGKNKVTISYGELSTYFEINVIQKEVDQKYSVLEEEAKNLLIKFGVENPTSPKNYSLKIDINGDGVITAGGELDYSEETISDLYALLYLSVFSGYTLVEGPVETSELIFPGYKAVLVNEELSIETTIYLIQFNGPLQYVLRIKKA